MEDSKKTIFLEKIKGMDDRDLLRAYSKKSDYVPLFCNLMEDELSIRGYNTSEITADNADYLIIRKKETEELVEIYTNDYDYFKGWKELAEEELKSRGYDMATLYATGSQGREALKKGVAGHYILVGYICAVFIGLIGLIIGLNYAFNTWKSPSGEKFHKYNKSTRIHGIIIFVISIVFATLKGLARL